MYTQLYETMVLAKLDENQFTILFHKKKTEFITDIISFDDKAKEHV